MFLAGQLPLSQSGGKLLVSNIKYSIRDAWIAADEE
jgi:hypothetical protein